MRLRLTIFLISSLAILALIFYGPSLRSAPTSCLQTQRQECIFAESTLRVVKGMRDDNGSLVILTACDEICLRACLPTFLSRQMVDTSKIVVIAQDKSGHTYCRGLEGRHRCSLEQLSCILSGLTCPPTNENLMTFLSPAYRASLLLKAKILLAVVTEFELNILWIDLDVVLLQNPLPALLNYSQGADMLIASERWQQDSWFASDVKKLEPVMPSRFPLWDWIRFHWLMATTFRGIRREVNGGLIFIKPTLLSKQLMTRWKDRMHKEYIAWEGITRGTGSLDQTIIEQMLTTWHLTQPETNDHPKVLALSGQIAMSNCWARWPCFGFDYQRTANGSVACFMPRTVIDRAISFHANCILSLAEKAAIVSANLSYQIDEEGFWKDHNRRSRAKGTGFLLLKSPS